MKVGKKFAYADDLEILHYASNWQVLKKDSYSEHVNPILLTLPMEAKAQYHKDCVESFPSLQYGATM